MKNELIKLALEARKNSYSPYSKATIGAAIQTKAGKVYTGCNVENASFGGTVCAERVAIWKAVSEEGPNCEIWQVAVASHTEEAWPPCGLCRQVISEFATQETQVHFSNKNGDATSHQFTDIFPLSFSPKFLK